MFAEITIKYKLTNDQEIEPRKATNDSVGHDIFAAEDKTSQPGPCDTISLVFNMEIPKGYFGKIYLRSGLLVNHFISCDGGVIDSGYRGIVKAIMTSHGNVPYEILVGHRTAQIIFHKVEQVTIKASTFSKTERQCGGFGSTRY